MDKINLLLVIGEILNASKYEGGVTKREIEYDLNLEPDLAENFLRLLKKKGLVKHDSNRFYITEKGRTFIKDYESALDIV